jgi:hypothetical protein
MTEDFNLKPNQFGFEPVKDLSVELAENIETTLSTIQAEIAQAIESKDPEQLASSYNKLITHIKSEGDKEFVILPKSPKSTREAVNTYLEFSKKIPKIDEQKAAFLIGSQENFSSNTMDQTNQIHGANRGFRQDPLVIEDSHLAATTVANFLNKYESPYFTAATSEQKIATDTLSPHTVDVFLGKRRPAIVLD